VESDPAERARWFTEEVNPHEAALRGYLHSAFPSLDVDDVVQESYLKLLRARAAGRIASTKSYLFSIARNTALTVFQRRRFSRRRR
jgi:DNA-directed RNA polymerase specialized sigma24 family protein